MDRSKPAPLLPTGPVNHSSYDAMMLAELRKISRSCAVMRGWVTGLGVLVFGAVALGCYILFEIITAGPS